ncbi:MAG: right-handed parallel beta-helix repeat-containing protein [Armatimonadetes bacterium]|nr:right-handed parallel beta-helix repeat-containing protein [Armatimonadota bacterium]
MTPVVLGCLLSLGVAAAAPTYYLDSAAGDDARDGTSPERAWKTLAKASATAYEPGSRLLLRAGGVWQGCFKPTCSGRPGAPLVVDRYGDGAKPRLEGVGHAEQTAVVLDNVEQWEIRNLDISRGRTGVLLRYKDFGIARHVQLVGLDIHDVHGGGDDGGILATVSGETTWLDGLLIEGCTIEHVDRNGILVTDYPGPPNDKHRSVNVVIRGNRLRDIGGDGIFILACRGALIERNRLSYAHQRVGRRPGERACAGIWPHRCEDTLIQFNEVSHTAVGGLTVWDSEAFDDDISCRGTVFQYNYSHDNAGGFLLICGGRDTIARYNISRNDATATFTLEGDAVVNALIHNNTVYTRPGLDVELVRNTFGAPTGTRFVNNLFAMGGEARYSLRGIKDAVWRHNAFWGKHTDRPADDGAVTADPRLLAPGEAGEGLDSTKGYQLAPQSPCIGAGEALAAAGPRDFWGNALPAGGVPCIGAHQRER